MVIAWPSLHALTERVGFERASLPGPVPPIDLWLLFTLCGAASLMLIRRVPVIRVIGLMALGTAVSAVLVALRADVPLSQYYPSKMLWQSCILAMPMLATLVTVALCALSSQVRRRSVWSRWAPWSCSPL